MKPYFDRYPENEKKAVQHYEQNIRLAESLEPSRICQRQSGRERMSPHLSTHYAEELYSLLIQVIDWMNPRVTIWMKCVDRFHRVIFKVKCQWYGYFRMFISGK